MRPLRALAALLLLPAAALAPVVAPSVAQAAASATCHGKPVTGTHGTAHDDVLVVSARYAGTIDLGAGADTVCVVGRATADIVTGDAADVAAGDPMSHDTVIAGAGTHVSVESGVDGSSDYDSDNLQLRGHSPVVTIGGVPVGSVVAPAGDGTIAFSSSRQAAWTIDDAAGTVAVGTGPAKPVRGFPTADLGLVSWTALTYTGGDADETLTLADGDGTPADRPLTAAFGLGDDVLVTPSDVHGSIAGSGGFDKLEIDNTGTTRPARDIRVLMPTREVRMDGVSTLALTGMDNARVDGAVSATLLGDRHPNRLRASDVCSATIKGGVGNDHLRVDVRRCDGRYAGATVSGGNGDDKLKGSLGDDSLFGGAGTDWAIGLDGSDRCVAEERLDCER